MDFTNEEFIKQFSGSASANIVTVIGVGVIFLLKKLIERPSRCKEVKSECCCCSFDVINQTQRRENEERSVSEEDGSRV